MTEHRCISPCRECGGGCDLGHTADCPAVSGDRSPDKGAPGYRMEAYHPVAPSPDAPMGAAAMADALAAWDKIGAAHGVAPSPDAPGLREAAQAALALLDQYPDDDHMTAADALRSALALPPRDALDVERLATAMQRVYTGGAPLDRRYYVNAARQVAREYAAQSKETP